MVITLYPGDEGYTLALKIHNTLENETARIPYEEDELLNCIESQQLPPVLVELLEEAGADVFYDGCVFVEVKDLRNGSKQSWNVLLKPSPQVSSLGFIILLDIIILYIILFDYQCFLLLDYLSRCSTNLS